MFAVIEVAGKQYKVQESNILLVDKIDGEAGATVDIDHVLLVGDDKKTTIGTPYVANASVKTKIVSQEKGEKIAVRRYKHKVRYRKHIGFRPCLTRLEIVSIGQK
jgi:large subunit ribosomal protein L21